MHLELLRRDLPSCPSGSAYYVCQANNFRGCCTVDACNAGGTCPRPPVLSSAVQIPTATIQTAKSTLSSQPPSSLRSTSSSLTSSSSSSSSITTPSAASESSAILNPSPPTTGTSVTNSTSLSASSGTSTAGDASIVSNPVKLFTIIGISCGSVGVILLLLLLALCIRKRSRREAASRTPFGKDVKDKLLMGRPITPMTPNYPYTEGDVFAPFGGYNRDTSPPGHLLRNETYEVEAPLRSPEDAPFRDMEKSALAPPPVHEHPAYRPLPGMSTRVPSYQPENESTLQQHPGTLSSLTGTYYAQATTLPRSPSPAHLDSTPISPHAELSAFLSPTPPPSNNPILNGHIVDSDKLSTHMINPQMAGSQLMTSQIELPPVTPRPLFSPRAIPPNSPRHILLDSLPPQHSRNPSSTSATTFHADHLAPPLAAAPAASADTDTHSSLYSLTDIATATKQELAQQKRLQREIEEQMRAPSTLLHPESPILGPNLAAGTLSPLTSDNTRHLTHQRGNSKNGKGSEPHVMSWATYGEMCEEPGTVEEVVRDKAPAGAMGGGAGAAAGGGGGNGNGGGRNVPVRKFSEVSAMGETWGQMTRGSPMSPLEEEEVAGWRGYRGV